MNAMAFEKLLKQTALICQMGLDNLSKPKAGWLYCCHKSPFTKISIGILPLPHLTLTCHFADCKIIPQAELSCKNDTLTVEWSTYATFGGAMSRVPGNLDERLLQASRHPILSLVIRNWQPPWVNCVSQQCSGDESIVYTFTTNKFSPLQ